MPRRPPPVLPKPTRFNPLDPEAIGTILRERLEQERPHPFPAEPFCGAGLYALYYVGDSIPEYLPLSNAFNRGVHVPVYVGKAEAGSSSYGYEPNYDAPKLSDRIRKHANSVSEVESAGGSLRLTEFVVKFLALDDAWIVLGERALLRAHRPVLWNTIVSGFGSNPPGTARKNAKSVWDTMHPGRRRAGQLPNRALTISEMRERIIAGVDISLIGGDKPRDDRLMRLKDERPLVIWAPARERDHDQRIRVGDERRFLAEIERLDIDVPEYRVTAQDELPIQSDE